MAEEKHLDGYEKYGFADAHLERISQSVPTLHNQLRAIESLSASRRDMEEEKANRLRGQIVELLLDMKSEVEELLKEV